MSLSVMPQHFSLGIIPLRKMPHNTMTRNAMKLGIMAINKKVLGVKLFATLEYKNI